MSVSQLHAGSMQRVRVLDHGWINGSVNYTATVPNWRLICPPLHFVATVILRLNLSEEFVLNMKHIQVAGCTDLPRSYVFNKKSIMVGVATNYNNTPSTSPDWEMGFICISTYVALHHVQYWQYKYMCIERIGSLEIEYIFSSSGHSITRFAKQLLLYNKTMLYLKVGQHV